MLDVFQFRPGTPARPPEFRSIYGRCRTSFVGTAKSCEITHIDRFFFVANGGAFAGAATEDAGRIRELIPVLAEPVSKAPGARAFVTQASLLVGRLGDPGVL